MLRVGVVTFPGSNCESETLRAFARVGAEPVELWHQDTGLKGVDVVILPGGFSYGDYLRSGAIARFSPIMEAVRGHAAEGGGVIGICNGFQILCEAGLLPGALLRNAGLHFVCRDQKLRVERTSTAWTEGYTAGAEIVIPVKNMDGRYAAAQSTVDELEGEGRVVFRYLDVNPNGSLGDIAGISSPDGRIVGLMPHPEHAIDQLTGPGDDGLAMFRSVLGTVLA